MDLNLVIPPERYLNYNFTFREMYSVHFLQKGFITLSNPRRSVFTLNITLKTSL